MCLKLKPLNRGRTRAYLALARACFLLFLLLRRRCVRSLRRTPPFRAVLRPFLPLLQ